jgi:hypothetical protein
VSTYTVNAQLRWTWQYGTFYTQRVPGLTALQALSLLADYLHRAARWVTVVDDRGRRIRQATLIRAAAREADGRAPSPIPPAHRETAERLIAHCLEELVAERLHRGVTSFWPEPVPVRNWLAAGVWWGRTVRRPPPVSLLVHLAARFGDHRGPNMFADAAGRMIASSARRRRALRPPQPVTIPEPRRPLEAQGP